MPGCAEAGMRRGRRITKCGAVAEEKKNPGTREKEEKKTSPPEHHHGSSARLRLAGGDLKEPERDH